MNTLNHARPKIGLLYLDHVLRFFNRSNFKGWPDKIEQVTYHWGNDKDRFVAEVKAKKIDVLIGNIPATAYETFRDIARELPGVRFLPSLDSQFSNKSKENVTHFCEKYDLPIPRTRIFYEVEQALDFLTHTEYPKIVKRSYGPSNYGGYFVHKVDSAEEALRLFSEKRYYPAYIQDFVPMKADIRVMLVGHQPVCAFWRRPPEGEWLTNTSQGGSMDYQAVPEQVLELAVKASKAANAEYWACDIAVSMEDDYTILECATAFAAFPYIRDWIGQYLMWLLAPQDFRQPFFAHRNWEELGKIDSSLLRTMRYISFGQPDYSTDTGEYAPADERYRLLETSYLREEEWPSEAWNFQGNTPYKVIAADGEPLASANTALESVIGEADTGIEQQGEVDVAPVLKAAETTEDNKVPTEEELLEFFLQVKSVGKTLATDIVSTLGANETLRVLNHQPEVLLQFRNLKHKKLAIIMDGWREYCAKEQYRYEEVFE
ncbi:ATP-grasp domain-containing protein [Photobacterium satsumensis]|uniref:ATP-grasp domain-containing protein n=1 Tax=Photobacterium satsumensis TaxID=2910239 RepID=UPI003D0C2984